MEGLFVGIAVCAIALVLLLNISATRRAFRKRGRTYSRPYVVAAPTQKAPTIPDSADQLRDVMNASFSRRKIMTLDEYHVFKTAEDEARAVGGGMRVFAQTSLGEVIGSDDKRAHSAINSKRVDILVVSAQGFPLVAVEYQGGGHYQSSAAARDAVKKEALRRAGVEYVEVVEKHSPEERRALIRNALARASQPQTPQVGPVSR
jgi:hypothetical protein